MDFQQTYFFETSERWNLGFVSPNYAGACVALLLPVAWLASKTEGGGWANWKATATAKAFEFLLWYAICRTYSRGALTAGALGLALWYILPRAEPKKTDLLSSIGVCLLAIGLCGFWARLRPAFVSTDGSVTHRIALWLGGLRMIASNPLGGCGDGQSGLFYANCFQPVAFHQTYASLVSGVLTVAAERGLAVLFLAMTIGALCIFFGLSKPRRERGAETFKSDLSGACACTVVIWIALNLFSDLWDEPKLWICPGLAALGIATVCLLEPVKRPWPLFFGSLVAATLAVGSIWSAGAILNARESQKVSIEKDGTIFIRQWSGGPSGTGPRSIDIYLGRELFVSSAVRSIRKSLSQWPQIRETRIHGMEPKRAGPSGVSSNPVILIGRQAERLTGYITDKGASVFALYPDSRINSSETGGTGRWTVILGKFDGLGQNGKWLDWANRTGAHVLLLPTAGLGLSSKDMDATFVALEGAR